MVNLIDLSKSYIRALGWATEAQKERSARRLEICNACPNKVQTSPTGEILINTVTNGEGNLYHCGLCGCPLFALSMSEFNESCKGGYWSDVRSEDTTDYF